MSVNRTSLGKRISFYRSKSNLTQEVLAAKVNCSREYIVQIENGTKIPSLFVLVKIANTLSVSADELLLDCLEYSSSSANSEIHRIQIQSIGDGLEGAVLLIKRHSRIHLASTKVVAADRLRLVGICFANKFEGSFYLWAEEKSASR